MNIIASFKRAKLNGGSLIYSPTGLLKYISSLATDLQIFLTMPVSVAFCERSFSKMKLVTSYLRSTMSQDRLTNLAVLSTENEVAASIRPNLVEFLKDFASIKARKVLPRVW